MGEIIYFKKKPYPEDDETVNGGKLKKIPASPEDAEACRVRSWLRDLTFVEVPGRREGKDRFAAEAKKLCDDCGYDLEMSTSPMGIVAELSMDSGQYADGRFNRLIGMADDIDFLVEEKNRDLTILLYYNFKAVYHAGERIYPEFSEE